MNYSEAKKIADEALAAIVPHCQTNPIDNTPYAVIAGSVRRQKSENIKDIEIVCVPKPYESIGFIQEGIAEVISKWKIVKGQLGQKCRYVQCIHSSGQKLGIFFAKQDNWGYILAIRTGGAEFSRKMAKRWVYYGYNGHDGYLHKGGKKVQVFTEKSLFQLLNISLEYIDPTKRNL